MATLSQLEAALVGAGKAGDHTAARHLAALVVKARAESGDSAQIPGPEPEVAGTAQQPPEPSLMDRATGVVEAGASAVTGATTGMAGMAGGSILGIAEGLLKGSVEDHKKGLGIVNGQDIAQKYAQQGAEALTYEPTTKTGQEYTQNIADVASAVEPIGPLGMSAPAGAITGSAGVAADMAKATMKPAVTEAMAAGPKLLESISAKQPIQDLSMGAAKTPAALQRETTAAQLPVPMKLTKGEAARDPEQLSFEKEQMKGPLGAPLRQRAEENASAALQNFDALIDQTDAVMPDTVQTGHAVIKALANGYTAAKNRTRTAYKTARNSPEAQIKVNPEKPIRVDGGSEYEDLNTSPIAYINEQPSGLPQSAVIDAAKAYAIQLGVAKQLPDGKLKALQPTVGVMEDWRRAINDATSYDPTHVKSATILKKLIDGVTEPVAGPLYTKARRLRTAQARKFENRAIVSRLLETKKGSDDAKVYADQVFQKSVLNSSPEEISFFKRILANSKEGKQALNELRGATYRHIVDVTADSSVKDSQGRPTISAHKLNRVVTQLDSNGRLDLILGKKQAQTVRDINGLVSDMNTVPPGTLVNHSGTAGMLRDLATTLADAGATNMLTGIPLPLVTIGKVIKTHARNKKLAAKIQDALNNPKSDDK